jgi:hypothetical protein
MEQAASGLPSIGVESVVVWIHVQCSASKKNKDKESVIIVFITLQNQSAPSQMTIKTRKIHENFTNVSESAKGLYAFCPTVLLV